MQLYTINDIATMMHVHALTVRRWIRAGRLESSRPEGTKRHLITDASLMEFLRRRRPRLAEISASASADVAGFYADQIKSERILSCSAYHGTSTKK